MSTIITTASREWAKRPDDERFLDLASLRQSVANRKAESWTMPIKPSDLRVTSDGDDLGVSIFDAEASEERKLQLSHFGLGKVAYYAEAPASYIRTLPAHLAADNLQWGLDHKERGQFPVSLLGQTNGASYLRTMTGRGYGRIWDEQVVEEVERLNADGRWQVPSASYSQADPKRATTLYASDRDVFIFLVDPDHPVEVGDEQLYRGFYTGNSEVGAASFVLCTFLYRVICDNRIIWGAEDVQEVRIRHASGAPRRFAEEGREVLSRYALASTDRTVKAIQAAQRFELDRADRDEGGWLDWLQIRGFSTTFAKATVARAEAEEGEARSLWDVIQGATAAARKITHTDERVRAEKLAGRLMYEVA